MKNDKEQSERAYNLKVVAYCDRKLEESIKKGEEPDVIITLYTERAKAKAELGQVEEAILDYKAATKVQSKRFEPHQALGAFLHKLGRFDQAKFSFDRALAIEPTHITYCMRAKANVGLGHPEEAVKDCEAALKLEPDYFDALGIAAQAHLNLEHYPEVESLCEQMLKIAPDNFAALSLRARCHSAAGRYEKAVADLEACIATGFKSHALYTNKSFALLNLGRFEEALADIDAALQLDRKSEAAWVNRINILNKLGRYKEAIDYSLEAIKILTNDKNRAKLWSNMSLCYGQLNDPENALKSCNSAIAADTSLGGAYNNRALVLSYLGRFDEATKDIERAMHLNPDSTVYPGTRGIINYGLGKNAEAIADLTRTVVASPTDTESAYFLHLALKKSGNLEEAVKYEAQAKSGEKLVPAFCVLKD